MAKVFNNIKGFFSDTKRRNIFTLTLIIALVIIAFSMMFLYKRFSTSATVRLNTAPSGIQSVPGNRNPTRQYVTLQNQENINKAQQAFSTGSSAIPTLIATQGFGGGTSSQLQTRGALPFSSLAQIQQGLDGDTRSLWADALINSNCSQESVEDAVKLGASAEDLVEVCGCDTLRESQYSAEQLRSFGFDLPQLLECNYSLADLRAAGFTAAELRGAGFSAAELRVAGFSATELRDAGFSAAELRAAGFSTAELRDAGFSAAELRAAGFSLEDLIAAGYSLDELLDAGFTPEELENLGFDLSALDSDSLLDASVILSGENSSCSPQRIRQLAQAGVGAAQLKTILSCTDEQLLAVGIRPPTAEASDMSANENNTGQASNDNNTSADNTGNMSIEDENEQIFNQLVSTRPSDSTRSDLDRIYERQQQTMDEQQRLQEVQQRTNAMLGQISQLSSQWGPPSIQTYVQGNPPELDDVNGSNGNTLGNLTSSMNTPDINAGDIIFAVLDTAVNSDEPGPVLATVVTGKFKGSKLLGSLSPSNNGTTVILSFNTMAPADNSSSISISAFAIDPNTARTALSSHTDRHILLRYGTLFASAFAEGVGNAFASSGTTVSGGVFGIGETIQTAQRSVPENLIVGAGEVGRRFGNNLAPIFNRPPTVQVYAGTSVGILFTSDVNR